jgi:methylmalonyl-CoA/ethylmalonyl-CoA epimerase
MIGRLNHVAIAVPDLAKAAARYRNILGAKVTEPKGLPEHGVTVVFVNLPNTNLELLQPLGENSPIAPFLAKNPAGGLHHLCYAVENIVIAVEILLASGTMRLLNPQPKIGAHGKPVVFLHPKDNDGVLTELEQA